MEIKIALAGNPNSGKTTLFNDLTGSRQYVGNWPGVAVEKKEGKLKGDEYKDVVISVGSNYAGSKTLEYIAFAASCYLMMYHYKLPYLTFSVINIINMPLGYIWTLIWWFVCDNLGILPKKTERKLNIVYISMVLVGLSLIIFDPSVCDVSEFSGGHFVRLRVQDPRHAHFL